MSVPRVERQVHHPCPAQTAALAAALIVVALLSGCVGSTARQAEIAPSSGVDSAVPVTCPDRGDDEDFIEHDVRFVNETSITFRLSIAPTSWTCDDYSGADNPSRLNGVVIGPNQSAPMVIPVNARDGAASIPVSVFKSNPGSDLPWTPVSQTEWAVGQWFGYLPDRNYSLRDSNGTDIGLLLWSQCSHDGRYDPDHSGVRFWPTGWKSCAGNARDGESPPATQ